MNAIGFLISNVSLPNSHLLRKENKHALGGANGGRGKLDEL